MLIKLEIYLHMVSILSLVLTISNLPPLPGTTETVDLVLDNADLQEKKGVESVSTCGA